MVCAEFYQERKARASKGDVLRQSVVCSLCQYPFLRYIVSQLRMRIKELEIG